MKGKELRKTTVKEYGEHALKMKFGELLYKIVMATSKCEKMTCKCDGGCGETIHGADTVVYDNDYFCVCEKCYDPEKEYNVSDCTSRVTLVDAKDRRTRITI